MSESVNLTVILESAQSVHAFYKTAKFRKCIKKIQITCYFYFLRERFIMNSSYNLMKYFIFFSAFQVGYGCQVASFKIVEDWKTAALLMHLFIFPYDILLDNSCKGDIRLICLLCLCPFLVILLFSFGPYTS